ncbi:hypothetical protein ACSLOR_28260, partial [Klebsiella pneumoniae]
TSRLKKLTSWIAETKAKADNLRLSKKRAQKHEFKQKVEAAPPETDLFVFLTCDFLFFIATSS